MEHVSCNGVCGRGMCISTVCLKEDLAWATGKWL